MITISAPAVSQSRPDCRLSRRAYEQPWYGIQWKARRYEFHAFFFAVGNVTALISRALGFSPTRAVAVNEVALNLAPHINGSLIRHDYPVNLTDWMADGVIRSGPLAWGKNNKAVKAVGFVAAYLATMCFASP